MAGEIGKKALHRLRTEGSRLKLIEIKEMLNVPVSQATLSAIGKGNRNCSAALEKALIALHNKTFPNARLELPKEKKQARKAKAAA